MKIALVVHDFLRGVGHGRYCIELAKRFAREQEVQVFANRFEPELGFSFRARRVPALRMTALTSVLSFTRQAEKRLRRENFDIIHAQGLSCRRADVITAHVCNAARYRRVAPQGLLKRIFPAFVVPRERKFYEQASGSEIIAVSNVLKRELQEEYGCAGVNVVYPGVNTSEFSPANAEQKIGLRRELNVPANKWLWLFAGEASKGLTETIQALENFSDAHLLVVSRSALAEYRDLAKRLGVEGRILFRGATEEMPQIYRTADVFVYPSRYDTFGLVAAEAMACGLPVVAGKEIGAAEWIAHRENGILCDAQDVTSELRWLRNQPAEKIADLGRRARVTALEHTWDECAAKTLEIYQRATASKRVRR
jgi:glycosyltransferase involved in cell wall biosynthesis